MAKTSIVKSFLKQTPIYLSAIVLGIILGMAIQMAYAAWTSPTTLPPNNNAPAPINVSTTTQTKAGSLIVATTSGSYLGIGSYRLESHGSDDSYIDKGDIFASCAAPPPDTCNGDFFGPYICSPFENKSCTDYVLFWMGGGLCGFHTYDVTCSKKFLAFVNKSGETKMVVLDDNHLGIGTTAPTQKLDVAGNIKASDYYIASTHKWVSSLGSPLWTKSGSNIYYNSGNVGIGITAPTQKLDVRGSIVTEGADLLSSCSICVRYADLNGRSHAPWRCASIENSVNTDFVGDVNADDDFDVKISCTDPVIQNKFKLCRRYADESDRVQTKWSCVNFGQELNTNFVGDVNYDDNFDLVIAPKTPSAFMTTCGICARYADLNGRSHAPWRCASIGHALNTNFTRDVNADDDFDLKLTCNIPFEDPNGIAKFCVTPGY